VKWFSGDHHDNARHREDFGDVRITWNEDEFVVAEQEDAPEIVTPHCIGCAEDPVGELEEWQRKADEEIRGHKKNQVDTIENSANDNSDKNSDVESGGKVSEDFQENNDPTEQANEVVIENAGIPNGNVSNLILGPPPPKEVDAERERKKLVKMRFNTAFAIALHNFPEGLATFVGALSDPKVGVVLAIAIGLHNIPEGMCVALPIYYATGNRCKGFMWGCLSGISEPIAALLGWAVLARTMSQTVYATLFGLVAGMMVMISLKELIPTAHRYDPEDTVVTYSVFIGMGIMGLSLVLLKVGTS